MYIYIYIYIYIHSHIYICISLIKGSSEARLPSYEQIEMWDFTSHNNTLEEGWCAIHITLTKGGVIFYITSQWTAMKGGVILYIK